MAEENKSQLISEAELIEAINADSLVSMSLGEGQPQKNVKLSTLASVVAGLIGGFLDANKQASSANTAVSNGIYYIGSNGSNAPISNDIGTVVVFKKSSRIIQHYYSTTKKKFFLRFSEDSGTTWSEWSEIV